LASLKYDKMAKALYIQLRKGKVAETEPLNDSVFVDLDKEGRLIGIEVVLPKDLPQEIASRIAAAA
jgi:uncharacterized protein YuzE